MAGSRLHSSDKIKELKFLSLTYTSAQIVFHSVCEIDTNNFQ